MNESVKIYLVYLLSLDNFGSKKIREIYEDLLARGGGQINNILVEECAKATPLKFIKLYKQWNIKVVTLWDKDYPENLKKLSNPPAILFLRGKKSILQNRIVTIVGTRNISDYSRRVISTLFRVENEVKKNKLAYLSGLAYGVDASVHKLSLECAIPTISVVAGGIDEGYPKRNQYLYDEIVKEGLIISEFPPGRRIFKGMFPMRNRIMATLANFVIVVQSPIKGGSMITANYALKYGIPLYVIPGNIFDLEMSGCLKLLREGAEVLFNKKDFYTIAGLENSYEDQLEIKFKEKVPSWLQNILCSFDRPAFTVDDIIQETTSEIDAEQVIQTISEMEILGVFEKKFGKYYIK